MGTEQHGEPSTATNPTTQTPPFFIAGSAFVLGLTTGLLLPRVFRHRRHRGGRSLSGRAPQETIVYDENLPRSLARREPVPDSQRPRYGGTGSLGVSPRAVDPALGHRETIDPSSE